MQEVYLGLSGAIAAERRMAVIANNLANANTAGFRADHVAMDMIDAGPDYELMRKSTADELHVNAPKATFYQTLYSNIRKCATDSTAGVACQTGGKTDVMLRGDGFFVINTPKGPRYTRAGNFAVTKDGALVTQDGYPVASREGGNVAINSANFSILPNGAVVDEKGKALSSIQVVRFQNADALEKENACMYRLTNAKTQPQNLDEKDIQMEQGFVEMSNVQIVDELVEMIATQRAYEAYQKLVHTSDEMNTQLLGTVAAQ